VTVHYMSEAFMPLFWKGVFWGLRTRHRQQLANKCSELCLYNNAESFYKVTSTKTYRLVMLRFIMIRIVLQSSSWI